LDGFELEPATNEEGSPIGCHWSLQEFFFQKCTVGGTSTAASAQTKRSTIMRRPALLSLVLIGAVAFMLLGVAHAANEEFELEESEVRENSPDSLLEAFAARIF
jgi:hypothetical protein